jgi:alpha-D-ribose 1-methylphosphonate 5-triphosphate synthase subunit PhnG
VTAPEETPGRLAEGLAAAARVRREGLLDLAEAVAVRGAQVLEPPRAGTVLVRVRGAAGAFCLTEAVVTTATALAGGRRGWGCVLGWDEEGALACALLAAARTDEAVRLAEAALADEDAARRRRLAAVAATRVGRP